MCSEFGSSLTIQCNLCERKKSETELGVQRYALPYLFHFVDKISVMFLKIVFHINVSTKSHFTTLLPKIAIIQMESLWLSNGAG